MLSRIIHSRQLEEYWFHEGCHILELANHPDETDVSIARGRVEPGQRTLRHSLSVNERYLIFSGKGMIELDDREGVSITAGDVVVIPAGTPQRIENTGNEDLVFYVICSPRFTPQCYRALEGAD